MLRNEEKQWELQVDHSLFAIKKLDITVSTCRVLDYYRGIVCPWAVLPGWFIQNLEITEKVCISSYLPL